MIWSLQDAPELEKRWLCLIERPDRRTAFLDGVVALIYYCGEAVLNSETICEG